MITWEAIGVLIGVFALIAGIGKFIQKQADQEKRIADLEQQLSWTAPEGPVFVHRVLFDMQNNHNELMISELREGFADLKTEVNSKLDKTNELLATMVSHLS